MIVARNVGFHNLCFSDPCILPYGRQPTSPKIGFKLDWQGKKTYIRLNYYLFVKLAFLFPLKNNLEQIQMLNYANTAWVKFAILPNK